MIRVFLLLLFPLLLGAASSGLDPRLLALTPAEGDTFVGLKADSSRNGRLGVYLAQRLATREDREMRAWLDAAGLNPAQDIEEIYSVSTTQSDPPNLLLALRGRIRQDRLLAYAGAKGATIRNAAGMLLATLPDANIALLLRDRDIFAIGRKDLLEQQLAPPLATQSPPPPLRAVIAELAARHDLWLYFQGSLPHLLNRSSNPGLVGTLGGKIVQAVREVRTGLTFGDMVRVETLFRTTGGDSATYLGDVLKFLASFLGGGSSARESTPGGASSLSVEVEGDHLRLHALLRETDVELVLRFLEKPRPAG